MIQKLLPFSLLFFIALPMIVIGQKYEVNGSQLIVKDTTYYNFKSVNYIGGELKRIDNQILDLKNEIKKNQSKNVDTETTSFSANSEKLRSLENSIASIKKDISAKSRIKPSKSSSNGTSSYWWLPWLGVLGLGGIFYTLFRNVKKSILIQPKDYSSEITSLKSDIAQSSVESQTGLMTYVNEQLELKSSINELKSQINDVNVSNAQHTETAPDHSLALKLADEINRMEKNLSLMDKSVKGHRQLTRGVSRLKDNLAANGYEITNLLGKSYNDGMKISATFIMDDSLEKNTQIISGVIKPQILFNGKLIQAAQIEVSQN
jgi:hypothetical protein